MCTKGLNQWEVIYNIWARGSSDRPGKLVQFTVQNKKICFFSVMLSCVTTCSSIAPKRGMYFLGEVQHIWFLLDSTSLTRVNSSEKWLMPVRMYSENAPVRFFIPMQSLQHYMCLWGRNMKNGIFFFLIKSICTLSFSFYAFIFSVLYLHRP